MRKTAVIILALFVAVGIALATIETEVTRMDYAGNGSTTIFPYTFKIYAKTDLLVIVRDASGNETTQTVDSDYTVSGIGNDSGGNVTFTTAPLSTETLVILRNRPLKQETDYIQGGPFLADSHENALDELTMIVQQLQEQLDRSVHLKKSSTLTDIEISGVTAGEYLRWNLMGDGIDSIDQVSDLGTFLQSGTGAVSRTAASKMGEIVSVTDFGAEGDGSTDDTVAIQAAINTGRPVKVPETSNYYKVTSAITLLDNSYIFGYGKNSQIRQVTAGTDLFVASSKSGIIIENLYLYGTTGAMRGIEFTTVTHSKIINNIIYGCGNAADGSGIWLDNASNDNEIVGNTIDTSYYGIYIGGFDAAAGSSRNIVEGNTVKDSVTAGIFLNKATHHVIKGNIVYGSGAPGIYLRQGSNYNTVSINTVYTNEDSGIYIWDGDSTDCIGNSVNGNTLYNNTPAEIFLRTVTNNSIETNTCMSSRGYGIYLTDAASKNVVANNVVKSATNDGIRLYYDGSEWCRENLITGNEVNGSGGYGISLYNAHESQVKDNMVSDNTDYGILITAGAVDVAVSHNTLKANDGGVYFNNADYCSIIENLIVSLSGGSSEYGINITANSTDPVVEGNRFRIATNQINDLSTSTLVRNNPGLDDPVISNSDAATSGIGEDDLKGTTIAADSLRATGGMRITAAGTITGANDVKVIKLYFGATAITAVSAAAGDQTDWRIEAEIFNTAADAQRWTWTGLESDGTILSGYDTSAIDTTANVTLKLTGECDHADDIITQTMWIVERL